MSPRTLELTDAIRDYWLSVMLREPEVLARLRRETAAMPAAGMQIAPEQGQVLGLLVELVGARRALDIGVFTGYSSLAVALALPAEGRLVACDINPEWTRVAERYWRAARVAHKIELRLGPAAETLEALLRGGESGTFDFAFIDADKGNCRRYYALCLALLRSGGLLAIDNALWNGRVADETQQDDDTRAIRALNAEVAGDPRVSMSLVPVGDGLLLARKR
jgi:predicted O-methyltransferase YrrM